MGLRKKGEGATVEAPPKVEAAAPEAAYPPVVALPADNELRSLLDGSDKEMRIAYAGLYQAVLQSQPIYASGVVQTIDEWHHMVDEQVDHFMRRVLIKSRKE